MLELLNDPEAWVSFLTLTFLEIVLGIDNIIFLSILVSRLPKELQPRGRVRRRRGEQGQERQCDQGFPHAPSLPRPARADVSPGTGTAAPPLG